MTFRQRLATSPVDGGQRGLLARRESTYAASARIGAVPRLYLVAKINGDGWFGVGTVLMPRNPAAFSHSRYSRIVNTSLLGRAISY